MNLHVTNSTDEQVPTPEYRLAPLEFWRTGFCVWNQKFGITRGRNKMEKKSKERRPEMKMLMRQCIRKTPTREKQEQFQGKGRQR